MTWRYILRRGGRVAPAQLKGLIRWEGRKIMGSSRGLAVAGYSHGLFVTDLLPQPATYYSPKKRDSQPEPQELEWTRPEARQSDLEQQLLQTLASPDITVPEMLTKLKEYEAKTQKVICWAYTTVIQRCRRTGKHEHFLMVYDAVRGLEAELQCDAFRTLFSYFAGQCSDLKRTTSLLKWTLDHQLEANRIEILRPVWEDAFLLFCRLHAPAHAFEIWKLYARHGLQPSRDMWNYFVSMCGRMGKIDQLDAVLRDMISVNKLVPRPGTLHRVMLAYIEANRIDKAEMLLQWIMDQKVMLNSNDLPISIMKLYEVKADVAEAHSMFKWLREDKKVVLPVAANNIMLKMYAKNQLADYASILLETMIEEGQRKRLRRPNVESFNAVLQAHAAAGNLEKALATFKVMTERYKIDPDETTNAIIGSFAHRYDLKDFLRRVMPYKGFLPSLLVEYWQRSDWKKVIEVAKVMDNQGISHTRLSKLLAAGSHAVVGSSSTAKDLILSYLAEGGKQVKATTCTKILRAVGSAFGSHEAITLYRRLQEKGLKPDIVLFTALIHITTKEKNVMAAEEVLAAMVAQNMKPDFRVLTSLQKLYCEAAEVSKAEQVFDGFYSIQKRPPSSVFVHLIVMYRRLQRFDEALKVFQRLRSTGYKPNPEIYSFLLFGGVPDDKEAIQAEIASGPSWAQREAELQSTCKVWLDRAHIAMAGDGISIDEVCDARRKVLSRGLPK